MTRRTPPLIERIVADLTARGAPRSSADLAREFLGLGILDEAAAELLLGPALTKDARIVRSGTGWTVRDAAPAAYGSGAPPLLLAAPHVACLAPPDVPAAAFAGAPPHEAAYVVACGGPAEVLRAAGRAGVSLPRAVVDVTRCARRLYGYRGAAHAPRIAEALRVPHLDPGPDDEPRAHAAIVLAIWERVAADLATEGIVDVEGLERLLDARLESADLAGRGFSAADLAALPAGPGTYLFRDARGRALYVGQSRNLAARVASYFEGPPRDEKDRVLRAEAHQLVARAVDTDPDALLQEARWIARHRPRLNTRLAVHAACTEDALLALRGGEDGRRLVFLVLRAPGLALRVACADTPRRRRAAAQRAIAALFDALAAAPDPRAGALVEGWIRAHPGALVLRPAIDGGPDAMLAWLLLDP